MEILNKKTIKNGETHGIALLTPLLRLIRSNP